MFKLKHLQKNILSVIFSSSLVLSFSAVSSVAQEINLDGSTPHSSFIENGVDPTLVGTWEILQTQIEQGGNAIIFPLHGSILSILNSGSFKFDYTNETNSARTTDIVVGQQISPSMQSPVATCKIKASGDVIGDITAVWQDNSSMEYPELHVIVNKAASTKPEARCEDSMNIVRGNMVTPSIGMGKPINLGSTNPYVSYQYMIDRDIYEAETPNNFTDLEIWTTLDSPVRIRYFLRKIN